MEEAARRTGVPARVPTRIGRFAVRRRLALDALGPVYEGVDPARGLVTLKVLARADELEADRRARLLRQARAAVKLRHPRIARVYEVVGTERGPVLVTERVLGESLEARLERGPLPLAQARGVATDIAEALRVAHAEGIVHRHLEPKKVVLAAPDAQGIVRAKVLDFGLAKQVSIDQVEEAAAHESDVLTAISLILGSKGYMAPEQIGGGDAGPRADLFSLGVLFYEMLTGRHPFADALGKDAPLAMYTAIAHEAPQPLRALRADLPANTVALVEGLLEKDPEARPESAAAVVERLGAPSRQTAVLGLAGLAALAALGVGAGYLALRALAG